MKRDARIGLAVVLVLGLSITLLVARSIHRHGAEAGIGDQPAAEVATAAAFEVQPTGPGVTIDPAYDAQARALLEFQSQHDYAPGPETEVAEAGSSTANDDGTLSSAPDTGTSTAAPVVTARSSTTDLTGVLPNLGEPPVPVTARGVTTAARPANLLGTYTVASGDNPWKISARIFGNGKYAQKIVDANPGVNPARLRIGQKINIPAVADATPQIQLENAAVAMATPATSGAGREITTPAARVALSRTVTHPVAQESSAGHVQTHSIQAGENLGAIAAKYLGSSGPKTVKKLLDANPGIDPRRLKIGYELKIPAP